MSIIASFPISWASRAAAKRFDPATRQPAASQRRKLKEILLRNQQTEYGRKYGFASIQNIEEYRARVPVVGYEDIQRQVDRMTQGEQNVLTSEAPLLFAQTSGTTGRAKYIPITPSCQGRDQSDLMRTWIHHALKEHPSMFKGQVLSVVSPAVEGYTKSGIPYGSASGHVYQNTSRAVRRTYALPYEVFLIRDYEAKYYALMRIAISSDVSFVGTANPSTILKMCEYANEHAEELLRDLADGTLRKDVEIEPELREAIEGRLVADPEKARRLEKASVLRAGRLLPADYWPNLSLIGCWKGGTVGAYIKRFPEWFDPAGRRAVAVRDWGYLSSEARGSIPLSDRGSAGVLAVNANVFEFVAVENLEDNLGQRAAWNFLGVDELARGQEYYVFLTTTGGLYRYDINDVIQVVGRYNATPTIVFQRKGRGMTSITGEKLSVNQIILAFEKVSEDIGTTIDHFKAEAEVEQARYVFRVEAVGLTADLRHRLLQGLDSQLCRLNLEYEAKRKSMRLKAPKLYVMKPGWYDRPKRALVASGKRLFQAKTILLEVRHQEVADMDDVEAVVSL